MGWTLCGIFLTALVAPALYRRSPRHAGGVLALVPLAAMLYFLGRIPAVMSGVEIRESLAWVPTLGLNLSFYLDGLSLLFALLILGIGVLISIYAGGYFHREGKAARFFLFLFFFMGSMLGVVLADNVLTLFVFWELTSFSSYLLIGYYNERPAARSAALQALLVTGMGGLFLLAGMVLLGLAGGSFELSVLREGGRAMTAHPWYGWMLGLVLIGAFTKSAQVPFHFWLPRAMEAPSPVSAYLHSATMVKAGVYLLARMSPLLGGTSAWTHTLTGVGAITLLTGAIIAYRQSHFKPMLAYSTVSALGGMTMLLGIGQPIAIQAAMVFLVAHAFYKAALFLVAGAVDHTTGEKDTNKVSGLGRTMPRLAIAAAIAALSMAGIPPLFGFVAKELFYEATIHAFYLPWLLTGATVVSSMFFVVVAYATGIKPFWGRQAATPHPPHEPMGSMGWGPILLGLASVGFALVPGSVARMLMTPAGSAVAGTDLTVDLALWHGLNLPLALSLVTLLGGAALCVLRGRILRLVKGMDGWVRVGPEQGYDAALRGLNGLATWQTRSLQSGHLRNYMLVVICFTVALAGYGIWGRGLPGPIWPLHADWRMVEGALALSILISTVAAVLFRTRLAAIASLGVVGYSVAVLFLFYGAPDLAMTQFVVETLTLVLLVLAFYFLPPFAILSSRRERVGDLAIALSMGAVISCLVLFALDTPFHSSISNYFIEHAVSDAHGRNIVNVILVDFRGLDTLGEITVLAVAGVGGYALLKLTTRSGDKPS